jgi:PhnB protein
MKGTNTYLIFNGNCREAMTFYSKCLGAELFTTTFAEAPGCDNIPPEAKDRIMHASLAGGSLLMASDNMPGMPFLQGDNFSININCESVEETERLFAALSENGKVTMPLQQTFWAQRFAMFTDRFGIHWMLNLENPRPA